MPARAATVRDPAELDRRDAELLRERTDLRRCAVVIARQEDDAPAAVDGRILLEDARNQMVEALDQLGADEGLRDDLGRRLAAQLDAVGVGYVDDRLSTPVGKRLGDIRVRLEPNGDQARSWRGATSTSACSTARWHS